MSASDIDPALLQAMTLPQLAGYRRALELDRRDAARRGDAAIVAFCARRIDAIRVAIQTRDPRPARTPPR